MTDDIELLLIGSLVAARLVALLLRHGREQHLPYLALLGADLVALVVAHQSGIAPLAFVAEGVGILLALAPGLLDWLEAALLRRDVTGTSRRAVYVARAREVLQPGRSSTERRRALEQRVSARAGESDRAIVAIEEELRASNDPQLASQLRGEIVRLLLVAGRAQEGIARAERQLAPEDYHRSPGLTAAMSVALSSNGRPGDGLALLALLERQAAGNDPALLPLLTSARLTFIAGMGVDHAIEKLLEQPALTRMLAPDEPAKLRALVAKGIVADPDLLIIAVDLAKRLVELGQRASAPVRRRAPVTLLLIALNLAAMLACFALKLDNDELGLARAGALYGPAVHAGEWWRLVSAMFLHAGAFHLVANMYALYQLGRATEEMLGWARFAVVYFLAGLGGACASLWLNRGLSVGASGAIMGLLAALTVVVIARRNNFHPATRKVLLGNLLFFGALQIFIGWQLPMIDSAAHGGGVLIGALATAGLAPALDLGPVARRAVGTVAFAFCLLCCVTLALVVRRPLSVTLLRLPTAPILVGTVRLEVPLAWRLEKADLLVDTALGIELHVERSGMSVHLGSPQAEDPRVRPLLSRISASSVTPTSPP